MLLINIAFIGSSPCGCAIGTRPTWRSSTALPCSRSASARRCRATSIRTSRPWTGITGHAGRAPRARRRPAPCGASAKSSTPGSIRVPCRSPNGTIRSNIRSASPGSIPADFICEGVDQTRGWFYSLLAIATGLGDALPHNNAGRLHRIAMSSSTTSCSTRSGQKMSKSRGQCRRPVERDSGARRRRRAVLSHRGQPGLGPAALRRAGDPGVGGRSCCSRSRTRTMACSPQYANFGWAPSAQDPAIADRPALDRWVLSRLAHVEREADDSWSATSRRSRRAPSAIHR